MPKLRRLHRRRIDLVRERMISESAFCRHNEYAKSPMFGRLESAQADDTARTKIQKQLAAVGQT